MYIYYLLYFICLRSRLIFCYLDLDLMFHAKWRVILVASYIQIQVKVISYRVLYIEIDIVTTIYLL